MHNCTKEFNWLVGELINWYWLYFKSQLIDIDYISYPN